MLGMMVGGACGSRLYPACVTPKLLDNPSPKPEKPPADPNPRAPPNPVMVGPYGPRGVMICCALLFIAKACWVAIGLRGAKGTARVVGST